MAELIDQQKAKELRALRNTLGLQSQQMAARLGVSFEHMSRMENGVRPISMTIALAVSAVAHGLAPMSIPEEVK